MAKDYDKEKQILDKNLPRKIVITRILAFSRSYNYNGSEKNYLELLKN
tara:strand:- start:1194 stop:1337 length:144 start_codon:yes stop_codon:yes gene_type:complete